MRRRVEYTRQAVEDLRRLDRPARGLVYGWVGKNLVHCEDPRRIGDGDPEGGRWRYCVGEYRLIVEIEADKIVILAVNTGLQNTPGHGPNVFLRSTLRQPVKTALLLAITALLTFTFVSRAAEYLLIRQETERLGENYRAIGMLEPLSKSGKTDLSAAIAYLEQSRHVGLVDQARYTSAVMDGVYNTDLVAPAWNRNHSLFGDVYLCGTLKYSSKIGAEGYRFYFEADSASTLAVYPEYPRQWKQFVTFSNPQDNFSGTVQFEDLAWLYDELEPGKRYLVRGRADQGSYYPDVFTLKPLVEGGPWYIPLGEDGGPDFTAPSLAEIAAELQVEYDNMHALYAVAVKDMSAMPKFQEELQFLYLAEGRLLDSQDDAKGRKVCVLNAQLAADRGLAVGDTITLALRDVDTSWAHNGYLCSKPDLARQESMEVMTDDYEIVGLYGISGYYLQTALRQTVYIPSSAIPETFTHVASESHAFVDGVPADPGGLGYVLSSPGAAAEFLDEAGEALGQYGFQPVLLDNGWEDFLSASRPMVRSSLANTIVFFILLVVMTCMITLIYFRMHRKEIAIARAIGLPARRCGLEAAVPLLLVGLAGVVCGGVAGWWYAESAADATLRDLAGFGSTAALLPVSWLAALCGAALVLLGITAVGGAAALSRRPVLGLLQGRSAAHRPAAKVADAPMEKIPAASPLPVQRAAGLPAGKGLGTGHVLRFVWRHIVRSKMKTALAILLAAGFTAGLAAIHLSVLSNQKKIGWLYGNTLVQADLVRNGSVQIQSDNFIRQDTVDALLDTGYLSEIYLESVSSGELVSAEHLTGGTMHLAEDERLGVELLATNSLQTFMKQDGGGMAVTFHSGWDAERFDHAGEEGFPVLLPKQIYNAYHMQEGGTIGILYRGGQTFEVAGYYETGPADGRGGTKPALLPLGGYQEIGGGQIAYSKVCVTLDPSLNRELKTFTQLVDSISASQGSGMVSLRAVIWDEELRLAVAPLENSIELMEVLYPVTLTLSLLAAAGIAVLFVMTSAREAAILRVLGTSKLQSRAMLAMQNVFTSLAGLLLGLLGVLAYMGRTRPELLASLVGASVLCAVLYLLAAIVGAGASAVGVTSRNPLELLQVRE